MTTKGSTRPRDSGQHATAPWRIPLRGWKEILVRTWNQSWIDNVGLVAAGVAFYGFVALIPLLGLIVLLYGSFAEPQTVIDNMTALTAVLPSNVAMAIGEQLMTAVATSGKTKGVGILVALFFAIYGGTNGASAIIAALNIAYQEKEKRSLRQFYVLALIMTFGAVVLVVFALGAVTIVAELGRLFPTAAGSTVALGKMISYFALTLAAAAVAATLYRFGPSREDARWQWITPGSIFTAVGWLLLTISFGFYVTRITDYSATYGSLGAVIALLTWMYLSAYVFVFGAELSSEIEHQTATDSTTGRPLPLGGRGAWAADHVARGEEVTQQSPALAEATPGAQETREDPEVD